MCGIFGYCGTKPALPYVLRGLSKLEYRGYDSAGIAVTGESLSVYRAVGDVAALRKRIADTDAKTRRRIEKAHLAIGHTRWATHGAVSEQNAHPHLSYDATVAMVHNGIIENFASLQQHVQDLGIRLQSETDSELIAHLVAHHYHTARGKKDAATAQIEDLFHALSLTCSMLEGTYALLVAHSHFPRHMTATVRGASLLISQNDEGTCISSDQNALYAFHQGYIVLEDEEIASSDGTHLSVRDAQRSPVDKAYVDFPPEHVDPSKGLYPDFMLKEIHEHPLAIRQALAGRTHPEYATALLSGLRLDEKALRDIREVKIISMGTSYYAGLIGARCIESLTHIPASAEMAAEFSARNPVVRSDTLYLLVSQSGETYDTIKALHLIKSRGVKAYGICNVVGSRLARESDGGCYTHSGPEIAVASTKVFSGQLTILMLLALKIARVHTLSHHEGLAFIECIKSAPAQLERLLNDDTLRSQIQELAHRYRNSHACIFLGRGAAYPLALEATLKLKEISYVHASGYSTSELKHGPIALVDGKLPCILFDKLTDNAEKTMTTIKEITARGGQVIVVTEEDSPLSALIDCTPHEENVLQRLTIPKLAQAQSGSHQYVGIFSHAVVAHLFAYYSAEARGHNIDKPRNLAKSVTVE